MPKATPEYYKLIQHPISLKDIGCAAKHCPAVLSPVLLCVPTSELMVLCRREYGIAKKKVLWHSRRGLERYYANISLMCDNCREYQRHADDPSEVGCDPQRHP